MSKKKRPKAWIILLFIIATASLTPILIDQQKMLYMKNIEMNSVNNKITSENKIKEDLQKQKKILNTDLYVEKVAREKLGMIKSGEKVFVDVNK